MGWGEIKAAGPERSSLLGCGDLHSPPQLPACRPGAAHLPEKKAHGKLIAFHSSLMGGGREDEDPQAQGRTWAIPGTFPWSYVGKSSLILRVKCWPTRVVRGPSALDMCKAAPTRSRATHWAHSEQGLGLHHGTVGQMGPLLPSEPPSSSGDCTSPSPGCAAVPGRLSRQKRSHISHQKLPSGPAVLPGPDGEIWSSLGGCCPQEEVTTKIQSCISGVRGCKEEL